MGDCKKKKKCRKYKAGDKYCNWCMGEEICHCFL